MTMRTKRFSVRNWSGPQHPGVLQTTIFVLSSICAGCAQIPGATSIVYLTGGSGVSARRRWLTAGRLVRAKESPGWHLTCGTAADRNSRMTNGSLRRSCRMRYSAADFSPISLRLCAFVSQSMRAKTPHSQAWRQNNLFNGGHTAAEQKKADRGFSTVCLILGSYCFENQREPL